MTIIYKAKLLITASMLIFAQQLIAKENDNGPKKLERDLHLTIAPYIGTVGIAVKVLETGETVTINDHRHYPMQSVYKFPLALYILHMVDNGAFTMDMLIHVRKEQFHRNTWSPLAVQYKYQDADVKLSDLIRYAVSKSDNNACDIMFDLARGPRMVEQFLHRNGVKDIAMVTTENEMHAAWEIQYRNWCRPSAMLEILQLFYEGKLLSKKSNDFLMELMVTCETSANRIRKLLPEGTIVADKTGTSATNKNGMTAATNDVGIITLPNGQHVALVVYVSDYPGISSVGEHVIADVAKCVWDHYTNTKTAGK